MNNQIAFSCLRFSTIRRSVLRVSRTCSEDEGREYGRNYAVANFPVYDFIMATQTESNDVSLDAKSCLSVLFPRHHFTAASLASFPRWSRREWNTTTTRHVRASKGCRGIFNIRGRPLRFRFCTLVHPFPFSVFGEGQGWCESRYCHRVP